MPDTRIKILLIEDDPLQAEIISAMISAPGEDYLIETASSLMNSLGLIEGGDFDLILLDLALEDSEGVETYLKVREAAPRLPVVVLTATGNEKTAREALEAGAQDYLVKWEMDQYLLLRTIRYAILRNRSNEERRNLEAGLGGLAAILPDVIALYQPASGKFTFINDEIERLTGYSRAEAEELTAEVLIHPEDLPEFNRSINQVQSAGVEGFSTIEYRVRHKLGGIRWVEQRAGLYDGPSEPGLILLAARDITNRVEAMRSLEASESGYRDLVENSGLFIGTHDIDGVIQTVNREFTERFGFPNPHALIGRNIRELLAPEGLEVFDKYLGQVIRDGQASGTVPFLLPDGSRIYIAFTNSLKTGNAAASAVRCIGRDVTQRIEYDRKLSKSETRLQLALDASGTGIWEWDPSTDRIEFDERASDLFGLSDGSIDSLIALIDPSYRLKFTELIETVRSGNGEDRIEMPIRSESHRMRWVECHVTQSRSANRRGGKLLFATRDITDRKRFESRMNRIQRLESIGSLASGIAHDLNNIMAPIFMALPALQPRLIDENSRRWLSLIYRSADRGRNLIQQMISFARGSEANFDSLDLARVIEDIKLLIADGLPAGTELETDIADDLWTLVGDETQIHQVLINLCINARDAMPEGGKLRIAAENAELNSGRGPESAIPGDYIVITISDTGTGIPADIIDLIFDPFFTTKSSGHGSGLGMSIVLGIVKGHGGYIEVESEVGVGTTFQIFLPAKRVIVSDSASASSKIVRPGNGESIMVVDDEEYTCEVLAHLLESNGYKALKASRADEAVELLYQTSAGVPLVLIDIDLPEDQSLKVIREIKSQFPLTSIIATCAIASTDLVIRARQAGIDTFLLKPVTSEKLFETLSSALKTRNAA